MRVQDGDDRRGQIAEHRVVQHIQELQQLGRPQVRW